MFQTPSPLPSHVPAAVTDRLGVKVGERFVGNCSGADVFRIDSPDEGPCYLKLMFESGVAGRSAAAARGMVDGDSLPGECERLDWLATKLGADGGVGLPRVLAFETKTTPAGHWTYLLTSAAPGRPLHEAMDQTPIRAGRLLGQTLRLLHDLDPSGCPAWHAPDDLISRAQAHLDHGTRHGVSVGPRGSDPAELRRKLRKLQSRPPTRFDPVVSHGDYCLPNVLAGLDDTCAVVDLGGVTVADRHLDLATAVRSLRFNRGRDDVISVFLNWYGRDRVDPDRLAFYSELCEII